ncbi:MAG: hypothetical protein HY22_06140 [[Candidatus Thermochlorobacteriaceae] bacterium GBChlB]|nr:MAG: hypothetical protein HY22_06140 [[Candidatus Thermochlorobacteriaceae] bacterium GBChlB]
MVKRLAHLFLALMLFVAQSDAARATCVSEKEMCCTGCCADTPSDVDSDAEREFPPCCQITDCSNDIDAIPAPTSVTTVAKHVLICTLDAAPTRNSVVLHQVALYNQRSINAASPPRYISFASLLI